MKKTALVLGGNGFIGHHLARKLKANGYFVRTVDIKEYVFGNIDYTDDYCIADLTAIKQFESIINEISFDEVYMLAAWMGGAGIICSGEYDAKILRDNLLIDLNTIELCKKYKVKKVFYSSSSCVYNTNIHKENLVYPANPDSDYGFAKLTGERLFQTYARNYGLDVRIARFQNIYGEEDAWNNGKEKAVAAICRKVAYARNNDVIEIWGDGKQIRSFVYIDDCLKGIELLMADTDFKGPVNIGSANAISINNLVSYIVQIARKNISLVYVPGPSGSDIRYCDNTLIKEKLNWEPNYPLEKGLTNTYNWILQQINENKEDK